MSPWFLFGLKPEIKSAYVEVRGDIRERLFILYGSTMISSTFILLNKKKGFRCEPVCSTCGGQTSRNKDVHSLTDGFVTKTSRNRSEAFVGTS